ncbi:MAG: hypothetical protein HXK82_05885 [Lachnospiraceae bacterium]|nr:hypothetical protein [Lachnospiraceae bacterium]
MNEYKDSKKQRKLDFMVAAQKFRRGEIWLHGEKSLFITSRKFPSRKFRVLLHDRAEARTGNFMVF